MDHVAAQLAINVGVGCLAAAGTYAGMRRWGHSAEDGPHRAPQVWVGLDPDLQRDFAAQKIVDEIFATSLLPYSYLSLEDIPTVRTRESRKAFGVYVVHNDSKLKKLEAICDLKKLGDFRSCFIKFMLLVVTKYEGKANKDFSIFYNDLQGINDAMITPFFPRHFSYGSLESGGINLSESENWGSIEALQNVAAEALYQKPTTSTRFV